MANESDQKKVSISSANPKIISDMQTISEPSRLLYLAVVISLLGAVGLGLVIGYFSPVIDYVKENSIENKESRSWMAAMTPLGALFGGLFAPFIIEYLGKKKALISHGIPFTLGWACFILDSGSSHFLFYVGRALTGLSCGLCCGTAPGYVSEISTVSKRGTLGSCFQLFITIGILLASIVGNLITYKPFAIFCAIPPILMSFLMMFMPESPIQIISKGPMNEQTINLARKELIRLRSSTKSSIDLEINEIVESQKALNAMGGERLSQKISKADFYKPMIYSLFLMLVQQMAGINAILFYANSIFLAASPTINLTLANTLLNGMQSIATFAEMFIVEKLGRRVLLIVSASGCSISLGVMAIFDVFKSKDQSIELSLWWIPLITLMLYIIFFSIGLAPVPWLMVPELTPTNNRSLISGVATAFNWTIAFLVTKFFEPLQVSIHASGVYFIFMGHTIICIFILILFLPETSGKSLEEIRKRYAHYWRNSLSVDLKSNRDPES